MNLQLSSPLSSLVSKKYAAAKEAGDLLFSPTTLTVIHAAGIPFQLRYCPSLAKKPTPHHDSPQPRKPKPNPFAEPSSSLLITPLPANSSNANPSHILVLNKYPVIPSHFILATKEFKRQTDLLEEDDLGAAYACLKAWEGDEVGDGMVQQSGTQESRTRRRLFAFFNSGPHSGASQPHRHIQFLPVEEMSGSSTSEDQPSTSSPGVENEWSLLADALTSQRAREENTQALPLTIFTAPLPVSESPSADSLHATYLDLYIQAVMACEAYASRHPSESDTIFRSQYSSDPSREDSRARDTAGTPARISYNLSLTTSSMALCPRRSESTSLLSPSSKEGVQGEGEVALNGTLLAGTLMVKAQREWDELRGWPENLERVLEAVGIPPSERGVDNGKVGDGGGKL